MNPNTNWQGRSGCAPVVSVVTGTHRELHAITIQPIGVGVKRWLIVFGIVTILVIGGPAKPVYAQPDLFGAISDLVMGALALPIDVLAGTMSGPPILGTVNGALGGAFQTLAFATRGAFRLLGVALPLAEKAAPFVLPFIL